MVKLSHRLKVGRIHHVINNYGLQNGGAQKIVQELHRGLLDRGQPSSLIGLSYASDQILGAHSFPNQTPYSTKAFFSIEGYLRKYLNAGDILHAHLFPANLFCSILYRYTNHKITILATEHSTSNHRRGKWWGRTLDRILYAPYHKLAAISNGTAQQLGDWLPETRSKTTVIPNGCRLKYTVSPPIFKRNNPKPVILSAGTLRDAKNYETALKAIALIRDTPFQYHIAGDGPLKKDLLKLAKDLGVAEKVTWLGWVDDIWPHLEQADIFLMPSRWEGFGLAAVEAMNAGLPVVLSSIPGLRELITNAPNAGQLVDEQEAPTIANTLQWMLKNAEARIEMGQNAYVASLSYGIDTMIDRYLEWYQT